MTTEDDFQTALDANPEDYQTRLVFADWLQERGDPRAEGYRALGALRLRPITTVYGVGAEFRGANMLGRTLWVYCNAKNDKYNWVKGAVLPTEWFRACTREIISDVWWLRYPSRREAEDTIASAFVKLRAEHRAVLLAGKKVKPKAAKPRNKSKRKVDPKKAPKAQGKKVNEKAKTPKRRKSKKR